MLLGFVDYVILAYNEPRGGMSIPLQRVKSLHRRAQANALSVVFASCPRRRRVPRLDKSVVQLGAGGKACSAPLPCCLLSVNCEYGVDEVYAG